MSGAQLFDERDLETFRLAVETWGPEAQTDMAVEELAELTVELQHLKRGRADRNDIIDEMADIRIMYEQLRWYFGPDFVDAQVREKMDRLRERLADAGAPVPGETIADGGCR
jgi:hypothetical protein